MYIGPCRPTLTFMYFGWPSRGSVFRGLILWPSMIYTYLSTSASSIKLMSKLARWLHANLQQAGYASNLHSKLVSRAFCITSALCCGLFPSICHCTARSHVRSMPPGRRPVDKHAINSTFHTPHGKVIVAGLRGKAGPERFYFLGTWGPTGQGF